jgi:DNA-binding response OmpR family regulator
MSRTLPAQSHVVVADPRPRDYRHLARLAGECGWHVHLLTTAGAALAFARHLAADLWMINTRLPDLDGFELAELLRDLSVDSPLFLVGNRYDPDEERLACVHGAGLYVCKDADHAIDCQVVLSMLANRGPPQTESLRAARRAVG